ncbi:MAG: glycosyltransferase family 2 protein [Candidatus Marsarchaeota archaeon]|nr:glycosyltransferase family 2 protein [Candidatus Marsarchaeota archaeon]MCL5961447.1 glycosyltransferase family 2 protein [Chloroflexota bacterium]
MDCVSVVIPNYNGQSVLKGCLDSLMQQTWPADEIIVVDNASSDNSVEKVQREFPQVRLIKNQQNEGFTRACNQGILASKCRYVLLLNSDTMVPQDALANLVDFMDQHPDAGAMGPRLVLPDGRPQPYAFGADPSIGYLLSRGLNQLLFHRHLHAWTVGSVLKTDWVSGACLMLRREALDEAGLLDEKIFMYFEDNDLCLRLRNKGWTVYYNPKVSITHIGGQSLAQNPAARRAYYCSLAYFYTKHYGPMQRFLLRTGLAVYRLMVRR